jgi:hypothetical protein
MKWVSRIGNDSYLGFHLSTVRPFPGGASFTRRPARDPQEGRNAGASDALLTTTMATSWQSRPRFPPPWLGGEALGDVVGCRFVRTAFLLSSPSFI